MAEAKKSQGKGLKKKLGPLPYWGWAAVGAGTFVVYRYLRARSAANAANAASGLTGGTLIPGGTVQTANPSNGLAGSFSSVGAWTQAMLEYLTGNGLSPADAVNATTSWLNGNCVSQAAYNALSQGLVSSSVGLPPGYTSLPTLSVCPAAQQSLTTGGGSTTPVSPITLPSLNAQSFPLKVLFGQYNPADYTQVGTVQNGVYQGANVGGGAPVYANVFGGFVQDFNMATLPNGTGIYVPTNLLEYVQGHTPAGSQVPAAA